MTRRLVLVPIILVMMLLAGAASCDTRSSAFTDCLESETRPATVVANSRLPAPAPEWPANALPLPNGTPIDARGKTYDATTAWGLKLKTSAGMRDDLCWVGGTFSATLDHDDELWDTWHRRWGIISTTPNITFVGTNLRNVGDGFSFQEPSATNWTIVGANASGDAEHPDGAYIHDDCVEDDVMHAGRILDSKFDGCMSFLSATHDPSHAAVDGSANTIEVTRTLVRLQPMHNSFEPGTNGFDQTGGFFKFAFEAVLTHEDGDDGTPPHLTISNSVFRADKAAAYGGNENGKLALPPHTTCDKVTLVGWQTWPPADLATWQSTCTNLTLGSMSDWNAAVANWDAAHPAL